MKITDRKQLNALEEKLDKLDYFYTFGEDHLGLGVKLDSFEVDDTNRITIKFTETYLNCDYAICYREYTRHPRFNKKDKEYLLEGLK